ncbi:MAG: hypothetical protein J7K04_05905 [Spirochaetales bacterium]|nr:hypothetical protein [Spirochaetales bacterium]
MSYSIKKLFARIARFSHFLQGRKKINIYKLKTILYGILSTREDEILYEECFNELDKLVGLELKRKNPAKALPLVQDHPNRRRDCREEYKTLLEVLKKPKSLNCFIALI